MVVTTAQNTQARASILSSSTGMRSTLFLTMMLVCAVSVARGQAAREVLVGVAFDQQLGSLDIDRMALG